ncbi:hypothetical protein LCGC14_2282550 [marine sediment metagenome]|uniref:DUF4238 domain-containing protein n=1 Tax=marine sediment metagenome TaxID=412755 RepID=A0A0F9CU50_9ZZZZ
MAYDNHHYNPKLLLRPWRTWIDGNHLIYELRLINDKAYGEWVGLNETSCERHLYNLSDDAIDPKIIEKTINFDIDNQSGIVINKLRNGDAITSINANALAVMISYLRLRNPGALKMISNTYEELIVDKFIWDLVFRIDDCLGDLDIDLITDDWLHNILASKKARDIARISVTDNALQHYAEIIFHSEKFIIGSGADRFLLSDRPVIVNGNLHGQWHLFLPISPTQVLCCFSKGHDIETFKNNLRDSTFHKNVVEGINAQSIRQHVKFVYGDPSQKLFFEKYALEYKDELNHDEKMMEMAKHSVQNSEKMSSELEKEFYDGIEKLKSQNFSNDIIMRGLIESSFDALMKERCSHIS